MNSIRQIKSAFVLSLTLTVVSASTVLALAEGAFFPAGLTSVLALLAVQLNERKGWLVLSTLAANILGVAAVCAAGTELMLGTVEARILSGAHLNVYLTWVVLFMQKQDRQYWWLMALTVLQLAVSSVLSQEPHLGLALIGMMFLIVWTLSLFTLLRVRSRPELTEVAVDAVAGSSVPGPTVVRHGLQTDSGVSWISTRFRLMMLGMCLASLLMSAVVFAAFPRVFVGTPMFTHDGSISTSGMMSRTGFREDVRLGEFGSLLQSSELVLQVAAWDQRTRQRITMSGVAERLGTEEILFRGNAMGWYTGGEWDRGLEANSYSREVHRRHLSDNSSPLDCIRIEIIQEPPVGTFAFVPTPVFAARLINTEGSLLQRNLTDCFVFELVSKKFWRGETSTVFNTHPIEYVVYCAPPDKHFLPGPPDEVVGELRSLVYPNVKPVGWDRSGNNLAHAFAVTQGLKELVPGTWNLAQQLCVEDGQTVSVAECVRRILLLLRDSGEYQYSLTISPSETDVDPVDDFLLNTKTGHCQYFASAAVLMLQSVGIPARIVNGFKGAQENPDSGFAEVLGKHAHVWVEFRHHDRWHTMDPVPASRDELLETIGRPGVFGKLGKAVSSLWKDSINNVTAERQQEAIQPVLKAWNRVSTAVRERGIGGAVRALVSGVLTDPSQWLSWQGPVGTLACLLPLAVLLRNRLGRWLRSLFRWLSDRMSRQRRSATHIVRFYENFRQTCARSGLHFPVSHTARENAMYAERHFRDQLTPDIQDIPRRIADAFNAVRYGDQLLTPQQTDRLGRELGLLTVAIAKADGRRRK